MIRYSRPMKLARCVALCLFACSKPSPTAGSSANKPTGDVCQQVSDKARPIIEEIGNAAGQPMTDLDYEKMTQQCRDRLAQGEPLDPDSKCMLDAPDQAGVRACYVAGVKAYMRSSQLLEQRGALRRLGSALSITFIDGNAYPIGKAGPTPAIPCCAQPRQACANDPTEWSGSPVWAAAGVDRAFSPHYQFTYESDDPKSYTATAIGDPDCDGHPVTIKLVGSVDASGQPQTKLDDVK